MNQSRDKILKSKSGEGMPLTAQGSLGLLALGDVGLELWRKAIEEQKSLNEKPTLTQDKNGAQ